MKDHESRIAETALGRRVIERQAEKAEAPGPRQHDAASQVSCRIGDAACAGAHADALSRSTDTRVSRARDSLLRLQRQYGNRFLQRILAVSRQADEGGEAPPEVERAIHSKRGGGQALDSGVRGRMESALGADFRSVRVHTDSESDSLNRSLNARAFTTGSDVFFRQGAYSPGSSTGRELLAHELTHVVQQSGEEVRPKLTVGAPGDRYEQEADRVAREVTQREQHRGVTHRQVEEEEEHPIGAKAARTSLQRQEEPESEEEPVQACRDSRCDQQAELGPKEIY